MTVNEIRDAREALEKKILALCEEFRAQTGFSVTGCQIHGAEAWSLAEKHPKFVAHGVSIDLESI